MKIVRTVFASSLLFGATSGTAGAVELCFELDKFNDVFRLEFTDIGVNTVVLGQDESIGSGTQGSYALPLIGNTVTAPPPNTDPLVKIVGLHGVNQSKFFGNHADCTIDFLTGTSSPPSLNLTCVGRAGGTFNRKNVTATIIDCATATTARARRAVPGSLKALGQDDGWTGE